MTPEKVLCRIRVEKPEADEDDHEQVQGPVLLPLSHCPDVSSEIRINWATEIVKHIGQKRERNYIRPWNFVARLDGSVESLKTPTLEDGLSHGYPARFQIPPSTLHDLEPDEKIRRTEMFAMGSLLYEIMSGRQPFEELTDGEVQQRFMSGEVPQDAADMSVSLLIQSAWSVEFSEKVAEQVEAQNSNLFHAAVQYTKAHPIRTGLVVMGLTVTVVSLLAMPILGAAGFTAIGPAANSAAAAWQASIGLVEAGSLFAWCQSAAMGGAAVGGIVAAGLAGGAGAALARWADVKALKRVYRTAASITTPKLTAHTVASSWQNFTGVVHGLSQKAFHKN